MLDLDPGSAFCETLDPDRHLSQNLGAVTAQNEAVDAHNGGLEALVAQCVKGQLPR